jgi:hypothetical protein
MKCTPDPSTFWQRLQHNGETNTATLLSAGLRPEVVKEVVCPVCRMRENSLFWSCQERTEHFLHLRCPRCERGSIWYSLKKNEPVESFLKLSRVLCGSAALLLMAIIGAAGSVGVSLSDLLPPRLEARAVAAREAAAQGRQHLDYAVGWLGVTASTGYHRALLLKETKNLSGPDDSPLLGYRARQVWNTVAALGPE